MRVLRDTESINTEIRENTDQQISNLLTRHVDFAAEYHDPDVGNLLTVFVVEPGDTLAVRFPPKLTFDLVEPNGSRESLAVARAVHGARRTMRTGA